jgi:hypothetical protein
MDEVKRAMKEADPETLRSMRGFLRESGLLPELLTEVERTLTEKLGAILEQSTMPLFSHSNPEWTVEYSSNNSGGSWRLKDEDWKKLEEAGWKVAWKKDDTDIGGRPYKDGRWLGALATRASLTVRAKSAGEATEIAVTEWERITGQDPDAEGCSCCGPPHYFHASEKEEETAEEAA